MFSRPSLFSIDARLRLTAAIAGSCLLTGLGGCDDSSRPPPVNAPLQASPSTPVGSATPTTLSFELKPEPGPTGPDALRIYDCSFDGEGKVAQFKIRFKEEHRATGEFTTAAGQGRFVSVPGSDDSALLETLGRVLGSKEAPKGVTRVPELLFDIEVLGEGQSQETNGGFTSMPPGDWIATKVIMPRGGDKGELYMNINPVAGRGEFTVKDAKFGDYLIGELSKVL